MEATYTYIDLFYPKLARPCAQACGVSDDSVEGIFPASEEQVHCMEHHIQTGSYVLQTVLQFQGNMTKNFLCGVLNMIRSKNAVLRTRLVKYEGRVFQVILEDFVELRQVKADIDVFLAHDSALRMGYGTPLFRYTLVQGPQESFIVLTAHCSAVDPCTRRLMFGELQTAFSDPQAYQRLPPRTPYSLYAKVLSFQCAKLPLWLTQNYTAFDKLEHKFPVLTQAMMPSISTMRDKELLILPRVGGVTEFSLATMGHTAWALTIANLRRQEPIHISNPRPGEATPDRSYDISFVCKIPARRRIVSGKPWIGNFDVMGPISGLVPLRFSFGPNIYLEDVMAHLQNQVSYFSEWEGCIGDYVIKALGSEGGFQSMFNQAIFSWNSPGIDISSTQIVCDDRISGRAVLTQREDLSTTYAHDYGILIEVYSHKDHIAICSTWDERLVQKEFVKRVIRDFKALLTLIITTRGCTLQQLLDMPRADRP